MEFKATVLKKQKEYTAVESQVIGETQTQLIMNLDSVQSGFRATQDWN